METSLSELKLKLTETELTHIFSRCEVKDSGCWEWTGAGRRYGSVFQGIPIHRQMWVLANNRQIKRGIFICHNCDNPRCVNPEHLFEGTHTANMTDASTKGRLKGRNLNSKKTHCPKGHPYTGENILWTNKKSHTLLRRCRACLKLRDRRKDPKDFKGNAAKTQCPKGHPYSAANTKWVANNTARMCRECKRARKRK